MGAFLIERLNFLSTIQASLYTVDRCAQTMWRRCTDRVAVLHVTYFCSVNGVSHVMTLWSSAYAIYAQHQLQVEPRVEHQIIYSLVLAWLLRAQGLLNLKPRPATASVWLAERWQVIILSPYNLQPHGGAD